MKIYLLDEHTYDELGTPSLFYEVDCIGLSNETKYDKFVVNINKIQETSNG